MLQIYNNLTRSKEIFEPLQSGKIRMYVCGVTVYDYCHIGHARTFINFDIITRYFRHAGYELTYIRNITDIDDKIIQRASQSNQPFEQLTQTFIAAMNEDFLALGIALPDKEPRATDHIAEIIQMILQLIERGYAYVGDNGDVYYDVSQFPDYGKLSGQNVEQLRAGARIDISEQKQDSVDFALWKAAKPGEPKWPSPWGDGRPGWHIECSAMSTCCLGNNFDIHGGGSDLKFPHHENEIAQAEGATGKPYANTWIHTGMLQIDKEKMSKSLNNFFTIRDVLKEFDGESIRFFMANAHYRSPLNYSLENLQNAHSALSRMYTCLRGLDLSKQTHEKIDSDLYVNRFMKAMDDDFNTPEAIAVLFDLVRETNRYRNENINLAIEYGKELKKLAAVLGFLDNNPDTFLQGDDRHQQGDSDEITSLIKAREDARKNKNWQESDRIRDVLLDRGIILEDSAEGTIWRKK